MSGEGPVRLACALCDTEEFDGIHSIPDGWMDVSEIQSLARAREEIDPNDVTRSVMEWWTHLGTCPDCVQRELLEETCARITPQRLEAIMKLKRWKNGGALCRERPDIPDVTPEEDEAIWMTALYHLINMHPENHGA